MYGTGRKLTTISCPLPEKEKAAIRSTFVTAEDPEALWPSLLNLTGLVYRELEGHDVPVTQEMLHAYYQDLRQTKDTEKGK